jgi:hypothetical protein
MSGYSLSNSAPVNNPGYYDTPIHNQYSNPERNGPYKQLTSHQFNSYVGEEFNSNDDNYEVYQMQSYPSSDLFENYNNNNNHGYTNSDGSQSGSQLVRRNPQIEHFINDEHDIEQTTNRLDVNKTMRNRPINRGMHSQMDQRPYRRHGQHYPQRRAPQVVYNQYLPRQPAVQYNDYYYDSPGYLNVGSIPNIAGLYNNMPRRPETIIVKEVDTDAKITDYNSDDDDDDDDNDDTSVNTKKSSKSSDSKETKISNLKKKLEKGKKLKKKKNNMMYLVIFLLIIIVGLMLYIILNPKAAKKVRF